MSRPGHNGGPTMEGGEGWRRHCWRQARENLLPHLPVEVVRLRVRRAAELGLDYRTYASVRAASGHDVVAFLFSSNALRLLPPVPALPEDRQARLASLSGCGRIALVQGQLAPEAAMQAGQGVIDRAHPAPYPLAPFPALREAIAAAHQGFPRDGVVLIGDMSLERDWSVAGRLAGYLPAERYFSSLSAAR
ncbi:hypothetical protein L0V05_06090 [Tabrizicola sp. J26]|uniref:hypothetical protein n=1 Tax=Alitabrizicola rongguiensis TaxID=2909234 RepID=UPI001F17B39D|nr:hypothetical protein [Tabrizicola rongguiensis]MCF1708385.1 hypothetical protein [Tabrizicola rongguiensis]